MKKDSISLIIVIILVILSIVTTYQVMSLKNGGNSASVTTTTVPVIQTTTASTVATSSVPVKVDIKVDPSEPTLGSKDAKVTIVEYSDFQCPFCERFVTQSFPQIKTDYIDTGKVKLVFRQFPLSFHPFAQKAAEASLCADEQGKFWDYHDKLFANQQKITVPDLKQYAADLKLDTTKFNDCLDNNKMADKVKQQSTSGGSYGVSGTPSFFVNGNLFVGAQPFAAFKQKIDAELAK